MEGREVGMPFGETMPRSFLASAVRMYAPAISGVYGISNAGEWLYIGSAENIQAALMRHLGEAGTSLAKRLPTGFVYEACDQSQRSRRQDELVREYEPVCNRHWSCHS